MYKIYSLQSAIDAFKSGLPEYEALPLIEKALLDISSGISTTELERRNLLYSLNEIKNLSLSKKLEYALKRVIDKIKRDRKAIALGFYSSYNLKSDSVDAIDFMGETSIIQLSPGTQLYQWCKRLPYPDPFCYKDAEGYNIYIGDFFTPQVTSPESLGVSSLYEFKLPDGSWGTEMKKLYCFELAHSVDCLKSTSGLIIDNWSIIHEEDGQMIDRNSFLGFWAHGGSIQYLIPDRKLNSVMTLKQSLAKTARCIE